LSSEADAKTVFIQDFLPIKGKASLPRPEDLPDFPRQFKNLFLHLKIHKGIQMLSASHPFGRDLPLGNNVDFSGLARYDWSRVIVRLVMSVTGSYEGQQQMAQYGVCRLGTVLAEEGWVPGRSERLVADYQVRHAQ
jgi:tyrosyl-DNA phosphodiesterase-1